MKAHSWDRHFNDGVAFLSDAVAAVVVLVWVVAAVVLVVVVVSYNYCSCGINLSIGLCIKKIIPFLFSTCDGYIYAICYDPHCKVYIINMYFLN